jgi:hypothetical protein
MNTKLLPPLVAALASALTGVSAVPTVEVPVEAWANRHGSPTNGTQAETIALALDAGDNVIVTGHSAGTWYTAKYAATNGAVLWERHGPSGVAIAIAADAAGDAVVIGSSNIIKYAGVDGAILWERCFTGASDDGGSATAMTLDNEGNVLVTGSTGSEDPYSILTDLYTAKYAASNGALLWDVRYNGPADLRDGGTAIAADADGDVVVTGYSAAGFPEDQYTAKYEAADGRLVWEQRQPGGAARFLVLAPNGDVVTVGHAVCKYAADDGAMLWSRTNADPGDPIREARALALDSRGNIVVVGQIDWGELCSPGGQVAPRVIPIGSYAAKYAAGDGALLWHHEDPACWGAEGAQAVMIDSQDNVVILGTQFNITKHSGCDGASLWETRYTGKDSIRNEHASNSRCLGLTSDGSVLITGGSDCAYERATTFLESRAMATVKYVMTQVAYPTPVVLALALSPEGARLRFTGDVGRTYRLQLAASPDGPWHTFTRVETAGSPTFHYSNFSPCLGPNWFCRVAAP